MEQKEQINEFSVVRLSKTIAEKYAPTLAEIASQIPLVDYTEKEILAESKGDRIFHGKWDHSLVVFDKDKPIAFIAGYERKAEVNDQYPENSLYISELGVLKTYQKQGIGRQLVKQFLELNKKLIHFEGRMIYSIQTNSANSNQHVLELYKSFGFKHQAFKKYNNRTDVVLTKVLS
jgi:ribosomal protein S18 acetylase RimI-like enzyme